MILNRRKNILFILFYLLQGEWFICAAQPVLGDTFPVCVQPRCFLHPCQSGPPRQGQDESAQTEHPPANQTGCGENLY